VNINEKLEKIRMVAPGTKLRSAIDNMIKGHGGALIYITESPDNNSLIQLGFKVDCDLTPEKLYELSKMDGAIVISNDVKRILFANVHLIPDPSIPSSETGMRHMAAERVAIQSEEMTICISETRSTVTIYCGTWKYKLNETPLLIEKVTQVLQTLNKYFETFQSYVEELSMLEIENRVVLFDVGRVFEKGIRALKIISDLEFNLAELGDEGKIAAIRVNELKEEIENTLQLLLMDYTSTTEPENPAALLEDLVKSISKDTATYLDVFDYLGYPSSQISVGEQIVSPRGYRLIMKIPRMPISIAKNVVKKFRKFNILLKASQKKLQEVEGIGEKRALGIVMEIKALKRKVNI